MITAQELKFIWINMLKHLGTVNKEDGHVYIQDETNLVKASYHRGWHTITIEVYEVTEENELTHEVTWKIPDTEDAPDALLSFWKDTLNFGTWTKDVPANWGYDNPFVKE